MKKYDPITSMKEMMRSCFAYQMLSKDSSYLEPYKKELGELKFDEVYDEYSAYLEANYVVKTGVYTDLEGCTYNELIRKE